MSSSETGMSTTWVSVTGGESASGAVGSSTTISISESDMRGFVVWVQMVALTDVKIDRHHPRKRMMQYSASPDVIAKARSTGCLAGACHRAAPVAGHEGGTHLLRH